MKRYAVGFLVLFGVFFAFAAEPPGLRGRLEAHVVDVDDGDTIAVMVGGQRHKIRLSDIDAPEVSHCTRTSEEQCRQKGQRWGRESGRQLQSMVLNRQVMLSCDAYDARYSRSVCRVFVGGFDVNLHQVRTGMAWYNKKYSSDARVAQAEIAARAGAMGLWRDRSPIEPWVWRNACWKQGVCREG